MWDGKTEDIRQGWGQREKDLCRITATLCYMKTTEKHFRSLKNIGWCRDPGAGQNGKAISVYAYKRIDMDINNGPTDQRGPGRDIANQDSTGGPDTQK